ncbi:hypothetical protein ACFE04_006121 [Oxalis oulophora]
MKKNDKFKHVLEKAESQGFKFERVSVQQDQRYKFSSKKKIVKKTKSKPQKKLNQKTCAIFHFDEPITSLGNNMFDALLQQESTQCRHSITNMFVNADVESPRITPRHILYGNISLQTRTHYGAKISTSWSTHKTHVASREYSEQSSKNGPATNMSA